MENAAMSDPPDSYPNEDRRWMLVLGIPMLGAADSLNVAVSASVLLYEARARKNGWAPGGSIMIHGYPNSPHHPSEYYQSNDWTDGCIALSNSDMVEVWMRTQDNIPIDIYP